MKTYYLQIDKNKRKFIADSMHKECELIKSVESENFRYAKAALTDSKWSEDDEQKHNKEVRERFVRNEE